MSDLTTLVNETTQIKTDLISTKDMFKTKMTSKGFDTSSVNTISGLVNLTDTLSNTRWESGNGTVFKNDKNSVNYQCNTEFFLFRNMDLNDIDLKGVDVGSIKVNVNFENGSIDGSSNVTYYIKADVVDSDGTIIKTGTNSIAMLPNEGMSYVRDLNINLSEIKPTYSIKVYAKTSISDRYVRINHVKVSADLKVGNNVVPTTTGKKWASGTFESTYVSSSGSILGEVRGINFKPNIVIAYFLYPKNNSYLNICLGIRENTYGNPRKLQAYGYNTSSGDDGGSGNYGIREFYDDGFKFYSGNSASVFVGTYTWIAFE